MKTKDIAIGVLLIAVVGLSGGLGFLLIAWTPKTETPPITYLSGLPDDWSLAPNSSYFILNNQTDSGIVVTLGDLLQQIEIWQDSDANAYQSGIALSTIIDPLTNIPITGVNVLDVLQAYHTYFAGDITFVSGSEFLKIDTTAYDLINKIYNKNIQEDVIIGIAANKKWLAESEYGDVWGNFSLFGENMDLQLTDLKEYNVYNNWTVDVYINGTFQLSLEPSDFMSDPYTFTYTYDRSDDWNLNRQYTGLNLSTICDMVGLNDTANFQLKAWSADDWASPHAKASKRGFTASEVYHGLAYNSTYWDYVNETTMDPDGVPLPDVYGDLPLNLAYELQVLGEYDGTSTAINPAWPASKICGYSHGPFVLVVPGRVRSNLVKYIDRIEIILYL
jgi:hypothetical protein